MRNQKWPLALAISSAIMLSGCLSSGGGGSSKGDNQAPGTETTPTPAPQALSFEGTAAKGIVLGGVVRARALAANGDKGDVLAETTTSTTDGSYKLTLPASYNGTPILIEVTRNDGTLIRCDLAVCERDSQGSPTISFGQDFNAPADFQLTALVPEVNASTKTLNATSLTSVAADLAFATLKATPSADLQDVIYSANAKVANRLKLGDDLLQIKVVDITNAKSVAEADQAVNRYNLLSAAVASSSTKNMIDALASFIDEYVETGIADRAADGAQGLTLESILEQALQIAKRVEEVAAQQNVDLGNGLAAARTDIANAKSEAANNGSTQPSQGEVPAGIGSKGLVAVKQFVQQIRDLANLASLQENVSAFQEEVNTVAQLNDDETRVVTKATGAVLRAIAQAEEEVQNGSTSTVFAYDSINVTRDGQRYSVNQQLELASGDEDQQILVTIDVVAVGSFANKTVREGDEEPNWWEVGYQDNYSGDAQETTNVKADLTLRGKVFSPTVALSIHEGSHLKGTLKNDAEHSWERRYESTSDENSSSSSSGDRYSSVENIVVTDLSASLQATLEAAGEAPFSFQGALTVGLDNLKLVREASDSYESSSKSTWRYVTSESYSWRESGTSSYESSWIEREYWDASINGLELSLSGTFVNGQNQLNASATLSADSVASSCEAFYGHDYSNTYDYSGDYNDNGVGTRNDSSSCNYSELGAGPAIVNLAVTFEMNLQGMTHPVSITVNAQNKGLDSVIGSAALNYKDGQRLNMNYIGKEGETHKAILTNHNNVVLSLAQTKSSSGKELNGTISWQDKQYATVDNTRGVRVKYTDGTTEYY